MEIFLNFVWVFLALALVTLWFRTGGSTQSNRRRQIIAIAVLIAILFPVISVSDDLMAIQNPSETDNCMRRDHLLPSSVHNLVPMVSTVPPPSFIAVSFGFLRYVNAGRSRVLVTDPPLLARIQNRPPPVA